MCDVKYYIPIFKMELVVSSEPVHEPLTTSAGSGSEVDPKPGEWCCV